MVCSMSSSDVRTIVVGWLWLAGTYAARARAVVEAASWHARPGGGVAVGGAGPEGPGVAIDMKIGVF